MENKDIINKVVNDLRAMEALEIYKDCFTIKKGHLAIRTKNKIDMDEEDLNAIKERLEQ